MLADPLSGLGVGLLVRRRSDGLDRRVVRKVIDCVLRGVLDRVGGTVLGDDALRGRSLSPHDLGGFVGQPVLRERIANGMSPARTLTVSDASWCGSLSSRSFGVSWPDMSGCGTRASRACPVCDGDRVESSNRCSCCGTAGSRRTGSVSIRFASGARDVMMGDVTAGSAGAAATGRECEAVRRRATRRVDG